MKEGAQWKKMVLAEWTILVLYFNCEPFCWLSHPGNRFECIVAFQLCAFQLAIW